LKGGPPGGFHVGLLDARDLPPLRPPFPPLLAPAKPGLPATTATAQH
jgi:hypothetical protein